MLVLVVAFLGFSSALAADSNCASPDITVDEKVKLNADYNDFDNNSIINGTDIANDLSNNYDKNDDGAVTEDEWIARYTCAYGDTPYMARFIFNQISRGTPQIRIAIFTNSSYPNVFTRESFMNLSRWRYELFVDDNCVNTDVTLEEKLAIHLEYNNHNNDSVVDTADIAYDLDQNYDFDHDGNITQVEWVVRWSCAYGDTAAYSRYVWQKIATDRGYDVIQASQFAKPPWSDGIPLDQYEERNRKRYEDYAAQGQPPVGK